ncbi:adenylylsulfate kinase-like kinase (plasmid) [Cylindrospermum stagnale PCC 7417]|uniref:Adenylyl-sulfate kinase n=1 Tax=Cylindrospermum stagnale PCC 7417 TaxID=56107 RepID=K9X8J3_9NOST|nr:adenylyl-sulfate kinase [Cylindrospermum stagnale]AFZ28424.1 adenylylsulfate kinase-like kinase [Cylindrospermum stagnale PCC 7417]
MKRKNQGFIIWLTGLSGSGKSTIAKRLESELKERALLVEVLDGDIVRMNLSKGLSFNREDRDTNVRRVGFVANLLSRNEVPVIVSMISPYRDVRDELKRTITNFIEVYINAPLEVCEARDVKGLYAMARAGQLKSFTGIDAPYEAPLTPDIICYTSEETIQESVTRITAFLESRDYIANKHRSQQQETLRPAIQQFPLS